MRDRRTDRIAGLIRNIADFPEPGIQFKDITPLLASPQGLRDTINAIVQASPSDVDVVCGIESRGFIFGAPVAAQLGLGLVLIRKPGKLPAAVYEQEYDLEYGHSVLNLHRDALQPGQRVLLVDDLLATGGTMIAAKKLIEQAGAELAHVQVVIELAGLGGAATLAAAGVTSYATIVTFQDA